MLKRYKIRALELSNAKALQIIEVRLDHEVEQNTTLKKELEEIDKKHTKEIKSYYWQNLGLSAALGACVIWAISASI
jgi:transcriptional accessory protein Tex/SPT6